jgi:hypothetical protein
MISDPLDTFARRAQSSNGHHAVSVDTQSGQVGIRRARPVTRKSASSAQPLAAVKFLSFPWIRSIDMAGWLAIELRPPKIVSAAGPAMTEAKVMIELPPIPVSNPKSPKRHRAKNCPRRAMSLALPIPSKMIPQSRRCVSISASRHNGTKRTSFVR